MCKKQRWRYNEIPFVYAGNTRFEYSPLIRIFEVFCGLPQFLQIFPLSLFIYLYYTYLLMYGAETFLRSCQLCSHSENSQQF
jgi:hypothetical protein